jgi:hypothetical protein
MHQPDLLDQWDKRIMLEPMIFKPENISFWDLGAVFHNTRPMIRYFHYHGLNHTVGKLDYPT